ncbi:hypothetical protein AQUSIP_02880 [Aquicella siphonis]|uniref:Uncharacterized protein n=1 Tax=Aquicella siphonis TaxID=254247 RepID=A0A5E4PDY5_9COXI|nr:hypothetical protein [Aquicella siphonis]VVC75014.1 hypothetical protein AQUSIP_02880 [Aquicella siphonis]
MRVDNSKSIFPFYFILILLFCLLSSMNMAYALETYELQASVNDEKFIINDENFEAKTYCFDMQEGDQIAFLDGSALGACVSATLYNTRTKRTCEVWCE